MVQAHGELYAAEFGWDSSFEALVARIVADYASDARPGAGGGLDRRAATANGSVASSAWPSDEHTARLRILLVLPYGRGERLGARLVDECVRFARAAGYKRMVLWTNDPLVAARRIYLAAGFVLTGEEPHHSYGVDLVGQTFELEL